MAAVIAVTIKTVGILLIVILLVIPPATARRFASSPEQMAVAAALAGVIAIAGGRFASARLDSPSGPSIVVAAMLLFTVTRLRLLKGFTHRPLSRRRLRITVALGAENGAEYRHHLVRWMTMNIPKKGMRGPNWPFVVIVASAVLEVALMVEPASAGADTGKWRHYRDETGLEAKDYLTLDTRAGDRTWTLIRACDFSYAAIETRVEGFWRGFRLVVFGNGLS